MTTALPTESFEEIVADVTPEAHWVCDICYPAHNMPEMYGKGGVKAICGAPLMNVPAGHDWPMCEACTPLSKWVEHRREKHGVR